jgi:predicted lipoprotein with Yx(FWY)xxD motif
MNDILYNCSNHAPQGHHLRYGARAAKLALVLALAALLVVALLALTGCGGGSSASPGPSKPTAQLPTVDTSSNRLGEVLVDSKGRTLYVFAKDTGKKSTCFGSCAHAWPPLLAKAKPTVTGDAKPALISTSARPGSPAQVTYNGHPLYVYQGDETPGKANGQGLNSWGGKWFAVSPAGKRILKASKPKVSPGGY